MLYLTTRFPGNDCQGRKAQGTLTYEEVSSFLPDEIEGTDRIDTLLAALDGLGIELVDGPDAHRRDLAEQDTHASDGRSIALAQRRPACRFE